MLQALAELVDFLDRYGETRWAKYFRWYRDELLYLIQKGAPDSRKAEVASDIRFVYGGMGSFNDLVIHPLGGHLVQENDVNAVNQTLRKLAHKVYDLSWLYQERT